ncbi:MAG: hypothetical protein HC803_07855 [Saprospiraceae bacterium]|nr:hypothetical protein [Saprospiraceae bacterium]
MIIYKALFFIILFAFVSCNIGNSNKNVIKNSEIQEKYIENIKLEENFDFFISSDLFIQDDEFQKTIQREVEKTTANSIEVITKIENYLKKEWKSQTKIFEFSTKEKSNLLIEIYNNSYTNHSLEFIEIKITNIFIQEI